MCLLLIYLKKWLRVYYSSVSPIRKIWSKHSESSITAYLLFETWEYNFSEIKSDKFIFLGFVIFSKTFWIILKPRSKTIFVETASLQQLHRYSFKLLMILMPCFSWLFVISILFLYEKDIHFWWNVLYAVDCRLVGQWITFKTDFFF